MRWIALFGLALCFSIGASSTEARAQAVRGAHITAEAAADTSTAKRRVRTLRRVEQMLAQGRQGAAIEFLKSELDQHGFDREIVRRLGRLYRENREWEQLEQLILWQIESQEGEADIAELRLLAESRFELGRRSEAIESLMAIIELDPEEPSYVRLVAGTLSRHGEGQRAVEVLLENRKRSGDERLYAQQLGTLYADLGKRVDAAREYLHVIVESPLNVSLMRAQIIELTAAGADIDGILEVAEKITDQHPSIPQLGLVLAELRQRAGDARGAWEVLQPLVGEPSMLQDLLQMAMAGLSDSRLPEIDPGHALASLRLSQRLLQGLLDSDQLPRGIQPRVFDTLNRTFLAMLANRSFEALSQQEKTEILEGARGTLMNMSERFPDNRHTTASLLRLAEIYVDALHRPEEAIRIFRRLHLSPNIGIEEMQMARVGLGRAYMAAGDTLASRELFTAMGKDMDFIEGQGRAHYHLGMLDFMGGEFETAKERLSSVAFEAPSATYTNDALDLALLLAEELMGLGDQEALAGYGRALYFRTVAETDSMLAEFEQLVSGNSAHMRARAHLELARHHAGRDDHRLALNQIQSLMASDPGSRLVPAALDLKGDILDERGDSQAALASYEAILMNHVEYIFIDTVREKIRALKGQAREESGDLP